MEKRENKKRNEEKTLIAFLEKTKEGEYAKIDESSRPYIRIKEETETVDTFGDYYYGIS